MYFSHFMKCTSPFPVTNLRAHPGRFCPHPWKGQRPCSIIGCRPNPAFNRVKRSWGGQPKGFENENIFQVRTELHILIINSNRNIFVRIVEQHGPCSSGLCALEINRFAVHTKLENFAAAVLFSKIPQYTYIIHDKMSYKSYAVWFQNNQCDALTYIPHSIESFLGSGLIQLWTRMVNLNQCLFHFSQFPEHTSTSQRLYLLGKYRLPLKMPHKNRFIVHENITTGYCTKPM